MQLTLLPLTTKQDKIKKRNERIRRDFDLYTKTKKLNSQYVVSELLADKYLPLEELTLWRIILKQGHYKNL